MIKNFNHQFIWEQIHTLKFLSGYVGIILCAY